MTAAIEYVISHLALAVAELDKYISNESDGSSKAFRCREEIRTTQTRLRGLLDE